MMIIGSDCKACSETDKAGTGRNIVLSDYMQNFMDDGTIIHQTTWFLMYVISMVQKMQQNTVNPDCPYYPTV